MRALFTTRWDVEGPSGFHLGCHLCSVSIGGIQCGHPHSFPKPADLSTGMNQLVSYLLAEPTGIIPVGWSNWFLTPMWSQFNWTGSDQMPAVSYIRRLFCYTFFLILQSRPALLLALCCLWGMGEPSDGWSSALGSMNTLTVPTEIYCCFSVFWQMDLL